MFFNGVDEGLIGEGHIQITIHFELIKFYNYDQPVYKTNFFPLQNHTK